MLKGMLKRALLRCGYVVNKLPENFDHKEGYVLHKYLDKFGNFDYESYIKIQTEGNKRKIDRVFVNEKNIEYISKIISCRLGQVKSGICHGTRRGLEQNWFQKYLGANVIGTEISDTAIDYPDTIQWDFHQTKPEWLNYFDFVYSNSFDHTYDPERCLSAWMSCLRPGGLCIIEHTEFQNMQSTSSLDPFGAEIHVMPYLVLKWGRGDFAVVEIANAPVPISKANHHLIIIQRFNESHVEKSNLNDK